MYKVLCDLQSELARAENRVDVSLTIDKYDNKISLIDFEFKDFKELEYDKQAFIIDVLIGSLGFNIDNISTKLKIDKSQFQLYLTDSGLHSRLTTGVSEFRASIQNKLAKIAKYGRVKVLVNYTKPRDRANSLTNMSVEVVDSIEAIVAYDTMYGDNPNKLRQESLANKHGLTILDESSEELTDIIEDDSDGEI